MGVNVSADVFGYSALVENAPGIGQSFPKISKNVDAISSMIYPSHWVMEISVYKHQILSHIKQLIAIFKKKIVY